MWAGADVSTERPVKSDVGHQSNATRDFVGHKPTHKKLCREITVTHPYKIPASTKSTSSITHTQTYFAACGFFLSPQLLRRQVGGSRLDAKPTVTEKSIPTHQHGRLTSIHTRYIFNSFPDYSSPFFFPSFDFQVLFDNQKGGVSFHRFSILPSRLRMSVARAFHCIPN